jgi:spermidine/putrescine transport system permease protein
MRERRFTPYVLSLPGMLWLTLFFTVPMLTMLSVSFQEGTVETGYSLTGHWQNYTDAFAGYETQIVRSLIYGLIATLATLALSYPLSYWIAFKAGRYKNLVLLLVLLPFFTPFVIRVLSWKLILADQGIFLGTLKDWGVLPDGYRLLATPVAVVCGMIYNYLPFMALPLYVSLEKINPALLDAAADLYSSRVQAFLKVTLPLSLAGVFAGSLLTFIPSVGDFLNADLLGSVNTTMIGQVIQRSFMVDLDYPTGSALSFMLMAGILLGVFVYARALGTDEMTAA